MALSRSARIILEYLPPTVAQELAARLHSSLPSDDGTGQIREHLNKLHVELKDEADKYREHVFR